MKQLKLLAAVAFMAVCLLFIACQKNSLTDSIGELGITAVSSEVELDQDVLQSSRGSHAIPFKATFYTNRDPEKLKNVECTVSGYEGKNYQEGGGNATHLGKFKTVLTFCSKDGGFYAGGSGYLEAANGDRLFIKIPFGQVKPLTEFHPVYEAYFKDEFEFCGGTGRFKGAKGGGTTDSLVDLWNEEYPPGPEIIPDHRTDHVWTGTLILPNGKKRRKR